MIESHLTLLVVILPLLAAPLVFLVPGGRLAAGLALLVSALVLGLAGWQLVLVLQQGTLSYAIGGWAPPLGIEYRVDAVNAFLALIVSAMAAVTLWYAPASVAQEIPARARPGFYAAFLLCLTGLLGIVQTGDIFNLFVFLEISALSSYVLISLGRQRQALTAAYQYLIMGTIGATFLLIGIGLVYAETGTLNLQDLAMRLPAVFEQRTVHTGFAFILIGVALKLALFPLHLWLPNAYTYAPSVVTVFLAATATKVAVYVMLRMVFGVFSNGFASQTPARELFLMLGVAGILAMSVYAIYQRDAKRLLAYSSVAQIGYMVLGMGFGTALGVTATLLHVFNHALMKAALFMAIGMLVYRLGSSRLEDFAGRGRQMPLTFAVLLIGGLSLIGIPGTAGFISKWYLVSAALAQQAWLIIAVILLGSLLAVVYVWKLVEVLYFRPAAKETADGAVAVREAPLALLLPSLVLAVANLYFGLDTRLSLGVARQAAAVLGAGVDAGAGAGSP